MTIPRSARRAMDELFNASALLQLGAHGIREFPSISAEVTNDDLFGVMNLCRLIEVADQLTLDMVEFIDDVRDGIAQERTDLPQ